VTPLDSTESFDKLLPSISNLHINVINAHTTAYTADILLQMKTNSPTNTALNLNQTNQNISGSALDDPQRQQNGGNDQSGKEEMVVDQDRGCGSEDDDCNMSSESHSGGKLTSQNFAMLPPLPPHHNHVKGDDGIDRSATLKPSRTDGKRGDGLIGEGLVSSGKVSFEGGIISIPTHSDGECAAGGPHSITPVVKFSEDGSSTKKRSKEATPRKISKTKQPGQAIEPEPIQQQSIKLGAKTITGVSIAPSVKSPPAVANNSNSNDHEVDLPLPLIDRHSNFSYRYLALYDGNYLPKLPTAGPGWGKYVLYFFSSISYLFIMI
jgi:hypothetical protein